MKKKSRNRLSLFISRDDYVAGIICAKLGLFYWALKNMRISQCQERSRLFRLGSDDAERFKIEDIANELHIIKKRNGRELERMVIEYAGVAVWRQIAKKLDSYKPRRFSKSALDILAETISL